MGRAAVRSAGKVAAITNQSKNNRNEHGLKRKSRHTPLRPHAFARLARGQRRQRLCGALNAYMERVGRDRDRRRRDGHVTTKVGTSRTSNGYSRFTVGPLVVGASMAAQAILPGPSYK